MVGGVWSGRHRSRIDGMHVPCLNAGRRDSTGNRGARSRTLAGILGEPECREVVGAWTFCTLTMMQDGVRVGVNRSECGAFCTHRESVRSRMGLGDSRPQTRNGFRPPPITHQATERSRAAAGGQRTATQQDRSRPTSLKAAAAAVPPRRAGYPMPTPGLISPFSAPSLLAPGSSSRSTKPYCSASFASR